MDSTPVSVIVGARSQPSPAWIIPLAQAAGLGAGEVIDIPQAACPRRCMDGEAGRPRKAMRKSGRHAIHLGPTVHDNEPRRRRMKRAARGRGLRPGAALSWMIPAMTDFRAVGTIMGPAGLTAVFGMGTGVAPPVWSPESRPAGGQARPGAVRWGRSHARHSARLTNPNCDHGPILGPRLWAGRTDRGGQAARLLGPVG
jgi:hypothetical protein